MNRALARHLWNSADVRRALSKEVLHLLVGLVVGFGLAWCIRYFTGRPTGEDEIVLMAVGAATIAVMWLVSLVRTVRRVLRENSLL